MLFFFLSDEVGDHVCFAVSFHITTTIEENTMWHHIGIPLPTPFLCLRRKNEKQPSLKLLPGWNAANEHLTK